jgi:polysaccharide deacetylase family protein (PEP-CTERM system associated)
MLLTVEVEDYYQVGAFEHLVPRSAWYRFERRVERNTLAALDLLDRFGASGTFFLRRRTAETLPGLCREIARRGHELASRGHDDPVPPNAPEHQFVGEIARGRDALEEAGGRPVFGHRFRRQWFTPRPARALEALARGGYAYDSSFLPIFGARSHTPSAVAHRHIFGDRTFWELPLPTLGFLGWRIPIAGGNYFRQFPASLVKRVVEHWRRSYRAPFVLYFHVWELDPDQPRITAASRLARLRHYRNLDRMTSLLEDLLRAYSFVGVGEHLGLGAGAEARSRRHGSSPANGRGAVLAEPAPAAPPAKRPEPPARVVPITVVVPCYNERVTVPSLANTLAEVEAALGDTYRVRFVFVDDGSTDGTWEVLQRHFGSMPDATLVRHPRNLGVASAILTGIRRATTEVVCSIDCDCSYDPHELRRMIPLLTETTGMVTASPYHPRGRVRNVPAWRLALSRAASFSYRRLARQKLFTYTSCFRVYRRSAMRRLAITRPGFLGVTEILMRLDLGGVTIVEHPTTLHVRLLGTSKMRTLAVIGGHVGLLLWLLRTRLAAQARGLWRRPSAAAASGR